jgi:aminoacylase
MTISHHDDEMISFLQKYLQINTAQPCPNYKAVCDLFKEQAECDGFDCNVITLPSQQPVIVISYYGSDFSASSLILNHHMDVVPATNATEWIAPPFGGAMCDTMIIGRGAQDAKGLGVVHYFALKALKDANLQLNRTIHMTIVPDEEIGGFTGTQQFIETDFFKRMNVRYVFDEGIASGKKNTLAIKVSERKPLQIRITTKGALAHGSKLNCFNAIHELVAILQKFTEFHRTQQHESAHRAEGLLISANITSLIAGVHNNNTMSLNIVPDCASATLDLRVPPTIATEQIEAMVKNIIAPYPQSEYEVLAAVIDQARSPSYETVLYTSLAQAITECGLVPEPFFFEASSDLRFYTALGLEGVGFTPFTVQDNMHGTNESVSLTDLIQARKIMMHFLQHFCRENNNNV